MTEIETDENYAPSYPPDNEQIKRAGKEITSSGFAILLWCIAVLTIIASLIMGNDASIVSSGCYYHLNRALYALNLSLAIFSAIS